MLVHTLSEIIRILCILELMNKRCLHIRAWDALFYVLYEYSYVHRSTCFSFSFFLAVFSYRSRFWTFFFFYFDFFQFFSRSPQQHNNKQQQFEKSRNKYDSLKAPVAMIVCCCCRVGAGAMTINAHPLLYLWHVRIGVAVDRHARTATKLLHELLAFSRTTSWSRRRGVVLVVWWCCCCALV